MNTKQTGWEIDKFLLSIFEDIKSGQMPDTLKKFLEEYRLATITSDLSTLIIIRKYRVQYWNQERRVLPVAPNTNDYHWGIGIMEFKENGYSGGAVYIPNKYIYQKISIDSNNNICFTTNEGELYINLIDLKSLSYFWRVFDESMLEKAFELIMKKDNTQKKYPVNNIVQITMNPQRKELFDSYFGEFTYHEKLNWFERKYTNKYINITVTVDNNTLALNQLKEAKEIIEKDLFDKYLSEAIPSIIKLKNNNWIFNTENKVKPTTIRKKLIFTGIYCKETGNIELQFNDSGIFGGHDVILIVNKFKYKSFYIE